MTKRIHWKKGMRLTDQIMRASDNSTAELVENALMLASAGRFGLFPSEKPFELSLNVTKGLVDVEALTCLAVTRGGHLIDIHYDTSFTNTFETRVQIPEYRDGESLILAIDAHPEQWGDTNDGYEEPVYSFSLFAASTPVPPNSLPIARIVNEIGWRQDDIDFVPPCLYVSSHPKYMALHKQFADTLAAIDAKVRPLLRSGGKETFRMFWPTVLQQMIEIDKERDIMTPTALLANVQKCVAAFTCACELDENIELAEAESFKNYIYVSYSYKDCYVRIKEGLALCVAITEKIEKIASIAVAPPPQKPVEPERPKPQPRNMKNYIPI